MRNRSEVGFWINVDEAVENCVIHYCFSLHQSSETTIAVDEAEITFPNGIAYVKELEEE